MVGGHGDVHTCKQSLGCAHLNMLTSGEGLAPAESGWVGGGGGRLQDAPIKTEGEKRCSLRLHCGKLRGLSSDGGER